MEKETSRDELIFIVPEIKRGLKILSLSRIMTKVEMQKASRKWRGVIQDEVGAGSCGCPNLHALRGICTCLHALGRHVSACLGRHMSMRSGETHPCKHWGVTCLCALGRHMPASLEESHVLGPTLTFLLHSSSGCRS